MSSVVREFPSSESVKRYARWLDGRVHRLRRGIDFDCEVRAFRKRVQRYCEYHHIPLKTQIDTDSLFVQRLTAFQRKKL